MRTVTYDFKTKAEAEAFQKGVEFVNDSAIEVESIAKGATGRFVVTMTDKEGFDLDDDGNEIVRDQ